MIWEGEFESRKVGVLLIVVNNELSKCLAGEFCSACGFSNENNFNAEFAKGFYLFLIFKIARAFHSAKDNSQFVPLVVLAIRIILQRYFICG